MNNRKVIIWLCAIAFITVVVVLTTFLRKATNKVSTVVVCSYGGAFQDAQRKAYFEPFERETGIKMVEASYSGEYGKIKAMVQTKNVFWDVVDAETSVLLRGAEEGMLEEIDYTVVDKTELIPEAIHSHGVATDFFSTVLAYNKKVYPNAASAPQSWSDFWDVVKFPGPRALRRDPRSTLEIALMADGVPMDKLYPLDVDRAFKSLDRIKDHVKVWWSAGHQPAQLLSDGEVVMASAWNGRIWAAAKFDNQPLAVVWYQGLADPEWWIIPKGAKNRDAAMRFIAFASRAENQANFIRYIAYGPTNTKAFGSISPEEAKDLPTYPPNFAKQVVIDGLWWAANEDKVLERWNSWLMK
jgi:putative spermidine/putrescine transport system substrate-binding protein